MGSTNQDLPPLIKVLQQYEGVDPAYVLLNEDIAAGCVDQKAKTLENWRVRRKHLPFVKLGRKVKYRLSDILDFLDRNTFLNNREAKTRDRSIPPAAA